MNKIITNREMHYIRIEKNDIVFQQDKICPDIIDAIDELKKENKQLKERINKTNKNIEILQEIIYEQAKNKNDDMWLQDRLGGIRFILKGDSNE